MLGNNWIQQIEEDVNEMLDIIRGRIEVKEIKYRVTILMTFKFISENSKNVSIHVSTEHLWGTVTRSGINIMKRVNDALSEIEKENPTLKNVLSFFSFDQFTDELMFKIISILNRYSFNEEQKMFHVGEFAQKIVHTFIEKEGIRGGEESSPAEISQLLPRLLEIREGTVSDPTCGIGDFLLEAYKYAQENGSSAVQLFGQDINPSSLALSKMIFVLHGLTDPSIAEVKLGDIITDPQWKEGDYLKQFDFVLMQFPFGLKNWGHELVKDDLYGRFIYGIPSASYGDMAFLLHALATLKKAGKATILVPHGVLIRGGQEQKIRERLLREDVIEAVIGLPSNIFPGTGIGTAILVMNKNKVKSLKNKVLFINAENNFEKRRMKNVLRQNDIEKIITTYRNKQEVESYSKVTDAAEIQQQDYSLLPSRFFAKNKVETKIGDVVVNQNKYDKIPYEKVKLTDVVEVNRGILISKEDDNTDFTHKLINLVDIQDGNILMDQLSEVTLTDEKKCSKYELQPGDLLISARGTALKIAIVPETNDKLLCSSNFMFLRVKEKRIFYPEYIKAFLESPIGINYIQSYQRGATVTVLSPKDMNHIRIPVLSTKTQEEIITQLNETEQEYQRVIKKAVQNYKMGYLKTYQLMGLGNTFNSLD